MRRISFIAAAFLLVLAASATDILVWNINVNNNDTLENKQFDTLSKFYLQSKDGTVIQMAPYTYYDRSLSASVVEDNYDYNMYWGDTGTTDPFYTDLTALEAGIKQATGLDTINYGAWEFFMELENNGSMVAWSEHLYDPNANVDSRLYLSALVPDMVNNSNAMNTVPIKIFNFGSHLVPEPTSGLLMMLGAGLLALRRRRRRRA